VKGQSISKNKKGNWELDQITTEALYYAIIERDSLLAENKRLRERVKQVEAEKKELVQMSIAALNNANNQLTETQEATENLNDANDELINVWRRLYKGANLNAVAQKQINGQFYFGLNLAVPIGLNWSVSITGFSDLQNNPLYFVGVGYKIF